MEQKKKTQKKTEQEKKLLQKQNKKLNSKGILNSPFPKKLYVYMEEDGNDVFYIAQTRAEDCIGSDETEKLVAVYEITGLSVFKVNIEENPVEIK